MKLIRFQAADGKEKYGIVENENNIYIVKGAPFGKIKPTIEKYDIRMVKILTPCIPTKIIGIGLNYKEHVEELNQSIPDEPIIFLKPVSGLIAHLESIIYPPKVNRVDYEAELAIIIKNEIKNITSDQAKDNILGYTCLNDVTARELQQKDIQWTRAKSFDTFCPVGPHILIDDTIDANNLKIELFLNGEIKQSSNTNNLIFSLEKIVSYVSGIMTLYPGDIITTGTPKGIGPMKKGDIVEVKIENIGTLKNYIG
ncbi:fumarylacetoacetate hydrolase family protein [Candidatus Desantisbacteria bacterium]|nr:fumarylacetoacetate hydrolase family protein [Candidatus Desantisbacteria bacterium]